MTRKKKEAEDAAAAAAAAVKAAANERFTRPRPAGARSLPSRISKLPFAEKKAAVEKEAKAAAEKKAAVEKEAAAAAAVAVAAVAAKKAAQKGEGSAKHSLSRSITLTSVQDQTSKHFSTKTDAVAFLQTTKQTFNKHLKNGTQMKGWIASGSSSMGTGSTGTPSSAGAASAGANGDAVVQIVKGGSKAASKSAAGSSRAAAGQSSKASSGVSGAAAPKKGGKRKAATAAPGTKQSKKRSSGGAAAAEDGNSYVGRSVLRTVKNRSNKKVRWHCRISGYKDTEIGEYWMVQHDLHPHKKEVVQEQLDKEEMLECLLDGQSYVGPFCAWRAHLLCSLCVCVRRICLHTEPRPVAIP